METNTKDINVTLSKTENKDLIAHHLQTAIKSLNQASMLVKQISIEDSNIYHIQNCVDIGDYRRKIKRILNRDYK